MTSTTSTSSNRSTPGAPRGGVAGPALRLDDLAKGQELARREYPISRDTLVRYAGASGDFNPIHYNDAFATRVGLPGVIAHGMLTMGTAMSAVLDVVGDPTAVRACATRFTRPVEVPALESTTLSVVVTVRGVDAEAGTAELDVTAEAGGAKVLGRARATVALAPRSADGGTAAAPSEPTA
ncbi:MaoC/PaaZ C-terminal domain-containing protein [Brachybacterium sp. ACRRE]|uniref:MaoC/PaaZ C-terminal domain-containing protein n=1 Tax=Brachybacterium sp. ACRRE TaxID=2918184 RepID=UPI001EF202D7|nr:MaoC/PaaZ C-terminal domain-containing protein [Brachybacterium sp. ACRRE]MCG7308215.1 MaoC family dehydratase N-terminal domain-containing protein [Brachybacterium sp. ACRRE]